MNTATGWRTISSPRGSATATAWRSSWRTSLSTSGCGWAAPRSASCPPSSTSTSGASLCCTASAPCPPPQSSSGTTWPRVDIAFGFEFHESNSKYCIVSAINDIQSELSTSIKLYACGQTNSKVGRFENLQSLMSRESSGPVADSVTRSVHFSDKLLYIYTSGTTGLPKAAVIKNSRSKHLLSFR